MTTFEIVVVVAAALFVIVYTCCWVFWGWLTLADRSPAMAAKASVRMLLVLALEFGILYAGFGVSFKWTLGVTMASAVLIPVFGFTAFPVGASSIDWVVWLILWTPMLIVKQFVFGFPDRDIVQLPPPEVTLPTVEEPTSDHGEVVAVLRPFGDVVIDGQRFPAKSKTGEMLAVGTSVQVVGRDGKTLIVEGVAVST